MKEHYCWGIYMDDGYMEHTCFFRDRCLYYPKNVRWLADNWSHIDDFVRIHPPQMPPPPNLKKPYDGEDRCHCPYFYEREGIARQNNEDKMKIFLDG